MCLLQAIEAALVFHNPHTQYTMEALRASWAQLLSAMSRALNETDNQILIRDSKGLTEEQLSEYRKSFDHFDKVHVCVCVLLCCVWTEHVVVGFNWNTLCYPPQDSSGQLDKNEYRACLLSLGYKLGNDPVSSLVIHQIFVGKAFADYCRTAKEIFKFLSPTKVSYCSVSHARY